MVEKVSEVSMSVALKGDSTPDDNALLKHIAKKKKQNEGGENISLAAMLPSGALVRLTTPLAQGGGLHKTEKQAAKEVASASLSLAADPRQTKKGDGLRRQVALAFTGQMATANTGKNSVIVQKGGVTDPLSNKAAASASRSEGPSTTPVAVNVATNTFIDAVTKLHQSATAQHSQAAALVNPVIVTVSPPAAEAGRQEKPLRIKEDSGEVRPFWQGEKQLDSVVPKQGEAATQSRNSPATLQQLKTQAGLGSGVKGGNEGQMLEVNYQFQRWSGDHSVRISVPTEARREGNVTLLPSDARAADVLLRNMGHLTGLSPDLLRPQQERDEQQQRRQQQQQDEDQE
ncbi:MAG: hypothetical protein LBU96_17285 [Yokenella regensburgei]|jgi:hypothetical protein|uniref:SpaN/EivJ family type III secretion system needle length determinant n=1 Tax=Yokenella regensburgei TaxID=158877 RepID=UPI00284D2E4F|nr:hypothetical protein [Yokenella regensburgei]